MRRLIIALVFLVLSDISNASSIDSGCYEKLLKGNLDSAVHQLNVASISDDDMLKSMSLIALNQLLATCGCVADIKIVQCGIAIPENFLTEICYAEISWGYFLVNKDFLDNLNIIFNRWD